MRTGPGSYPGARPHAPSRCVVKPCLVVAGCVAKLRLDVVRSRPEEAAVRRRVDALSLLADPRVTSD